MKLHTYILTALITAVLACAFAHPHAAQAKIYSEDEAADKDDNNSDDNDNADVNDTGNDNDADTGDEDQDQTPPQPPAKAAIAPHATPPMVMPVTPTPIQTLTPVQAAPAQPIAPAPPQPAPPMPKPISAPAAKPALTPIAAPEPAPPPATGNWWHPHPGLKYQIQYSGKLNPNLDVKAFDLDLVDTDAAVIQQLKSRGIRVICYFSAGSYEAWRPDARDFPAPVQGKPNGWKGEKWLDIRKIDILKPIMQARINVAAQKGCDAVDPDNVEAYDNSSGFPLTAKDQLAYNKMIATLAHAAGLAVSLKNDLDQIPQLLPYFDFSVNEQCFEYKSCDQLIPFIKAGKPVLNIEYKGTPAAFCPQANKMNFDSVKKDLDLDAKVEWCR